MTFTQMDPGQAGGHGSGLVRYSRATIIMNNFVSGQDYHYCVSQKEINQI